MNFNEIVEFALKIVRYLFSAKFDQHQYPSKFPTKIQYMLEIDWMFYERAKKRPFSWFKIEFSFEENKCAVNSCAGWQ